MLRCRGCYGQIGEAGNPIVYATDVWCTLCALERGIGTDPPPWSLWLWSKNPRDLSLRLAFRRWRAWAYPRQMLKG
jgi:hypothetical protein